MNNDLAIVIIGGLSLDFLIFAMVHDGWGALRRRRHRKRRIAAASGQGPVARCNSAPTRE